ncbi:MAG TPA: glycosyltransferase family 9 protein [Ignavibacteria bacterium]
MLIKNNCKFFPGDRPCKPHKERGKVCDTCDEYSPVKHKTLIIKLDAIGDVLRTTAILSSLKKAYPGTYIKWLTKSNAKELFINNDLVDEIICYEVPVTNINLAIEEFDVVINLDPSPVSSALCSFAIGKEKFGFGLNSKGKVYPVNKEAEEWFTMGSFDSDKKKNKKTYQQIIHEICRFPYDKSEIILSLNKKDIDFKNEFIKKNKLENDKLIVGINAGASIRWQFKKWRLEGYKELIKKLTDSLDCRILLYGGADEIETNNELIKTSKKILDTGHDNSLRQFIALMDIPQILITGDTLALHVAAALKKKVICLFGPTSYNEIEDYGRITKIYPEMECLVCYKNKCDFIPNCMDLISADMIFNAVKKLL